MSIVSSAERCRDRRCDRDQLLLEKVNVRIRRLTIDFRHGLLGHILTRFRLNLHHRCSIN